MDSRAHYAGFTTANTYVPFVNGGTTYDIDVTTQREGKSATQLTYAAVTARSHHPGLVQVLLMDGSARPVRDTIALAVWRELGTRAGGAPAADF
jgi:hypothetical protein